MRSCCRCTMYRFLPDLQRVSVSPRAAFRAARRRPPHCVFRQRVDQITATAGDRTGPCCDDSHKRRGAVIATILRLLVRKAGQSAGLPRGSCSKIAREQSGEVARGGIHRGVRHAALADQSNPGLMVPRAGLDYQAWLHAGLVELTRRCCIKVVDQDQAWMCCTCGGTKPHEDVCAARVLPSQTWSQV